MSGYYRWIQRTRADLLQVTNTCNEPDAVAMFEGYRNHRPVVVPLPQWPARHWTIPILKQHFGHHVVQVQVNRNADPDYEIYSNHHRGTMPFAEFLDAMMTEDGNNLYMTAQNSVEHRDLTWAMASEMSPLPNYLTYHPESAFMWLGRSTITPLHHDITNNVMAQIIGAKEVRLVAPEFYDRIDHRSGVHSNIGWLDDETAQKRGIEVTTILLSAGHALLLPVGWWHCVRALGLSATSVYTNLIWPNDAHESFASVNTP